jgi:hypothetical protein
MDRLEEEEKAFGKPGEAPLFAGMKHSIDNRGVILFTLRGGGLIRDTGKEIYFSAFDAAAKEAAQKYAAARWGKRVVLEGNQIRFAPENILEPERLEKVQEKERGKGLGR